MRRGLYLSLNHQLKCEALIKSIIYDKVSRLPSLGLKYFETGMITNFITGDVVSIAFSFRFLVISVPLPFMIIYSTVVIFIKFSWIALFLPAIFFITVYLQMLGTTIMNKNNISRLKTSDLRGKVVNETISGIKNIKFNAWEDLIIWKTTKMRTLETHNTFIYLMVRFFFNGLADLVPVFLNLVLIISYNAFIGKLELSDTLMLIAYGNMLMMPTKQTVVAFSTYNAARVSFSRIDKLLYTRFKDGNKI